jgi:stringent starvation protein B
VDAVAGIFARENNQGLFFPPDSEAPAENAATPAGEPAPSSPTSGGKPRLQIVK